MRTPDENNAMFCSELLKYAKLDGKRILDIGCGNGNLVRYIAKNHSPQYIVGIEPFLSDWDVEESSGDIWKIVHGNAHNLEFNDNEFDTIISFSTFEHIADVEKALSEIKRTLKPYGRFYTEFMPIWTSAASRAGLSKFVLNSGMIVRCYEERPALNRLEIGMRICLEKFSDIKEGNI